MNMDGSNVIVVGKAGPYVVFIISLTWFSPGPYKYHGPPFDIKGIKDLSEGLITSQSSLNDAMTKLFLCACFVLGVPMYRNFLMPFRYNLPLNSDSVGSGPMAICGAIISIFPFVSSLENIRCGIEAKLVLNASENASIAVLFVLNE